VIRILGTIKEYDNGLLTIEPEGIVTEVDGQVTKEESVESGSARTFKLTGRIKSSMDEDKAYFLGPDGVITIQNDEVINIESG
jgi:hypothetical protein